ncbi:MAG TPA: hypothetical protein VMR17_09820, partial [Xanthobacteraceae bacterium]|nr:hypothetical protein [Xanthobacteraceae bacterium]
MRAGSAPTSRFCGLPGACCLSDLTMSKIVLLGPSAGQPEAGDVIGLPFEMAPDSALCARFPDAVPLARLIGDFEDKKIEAHALARRLLADEPALRGVRQLGVFEEVVIRELLRGFHLLHLHDHLLAHGIDECVFAEPSGLGSELATLAQSLGAKLRVTTAAVQRGSHGSSLQRSLRRLRAARLAPSALRGELHQLIQRLDPYHRRHALRRRRGHWQRNGIWFYTTAQSFTNIGLLYEPYFPAALNFLVENPLTGGKRLKDIGRPYVSLYDFAGNEFVPSSSELRTSRDIVESHLMKVAVTGGEKILRDFFVRGAFFQNFLRRHLPDGLFVARVFERWLDTAQPAALVVGNPVFEAPALSLARQRGIPTLVLQHGILGDFCQFVDSPTDHYVVRGTFWRDFLAPPVRGRALVLNPPEPRATAPEPARSRRSIVFLTAPMQEFWSDADLGDILRSLVTTAMAERAELVIRVHPLERVAEYQVRLKKLLGKQLNDADVTFSQGPGLQAVLARAAVAVTYYSTVFLDCIRTRVPIVGLDWHHFSYKRQIEEHGVFHFAKSLAHLGRLVTEALHGSLPAYV